VNAPTLTLAGFGPLVGGHLQVSNLAGPPAKVVVGPTRGGVAELDVRTGVGQPVSTTTPVANADSVTRSEDTPTPVISLLANATIPGIARGSYSAYHSRSKDPMILPP
jgi:hypothetical protein